MDEPDAAGLLARFTALPGAARLLEGLQSDAEAYVVGGSVRDLLLGRDPQDVDVVLVAPGDPAALAERLGTRAQVHDRFSTATAYPAIGDPDGPRYDLALARREIYRVPGALPQVEPAAIDEDLERRDFTINTFALGLAGPRRAQLLAAPHALPDLAAGRLRVLHGDSFRDDPTRLLRMARYCARLGFTVDPATETLARAAVAGGALRTVSGPRVGAELDHLQHEADPVAGWQVMDRFGLDDAIAPGFGVHDAALARRTAALLAGRNSPEAPPGVGVLAVALLDVPVPRRRSLLDRLAVDRFTRTTALAAARDAAALAAAVPADGPPSSLLELLPPDAPITWALAAAMAAGPAAAVLTRCLEGQWTRARLAIDGRDLIAAGLRPGPALGAGLRGALGAYLDGRADTREQQLAAAMAAARAAEAGRTDG